MSVRDSHSMIPSALRRSGQLLNVMSFLCGDFDASKPPCSLEMKECANMIVAFGLGLKGCTSCPDCHWASYLNWCRRLLKKTRISETREVYTCSSHTDMEYTLIVRCIHNRFDACQRECWYLCCDHCESGRLGLKEYNETGKDDESTTPLTQTHNCWSRETKNVHFVNAKMASRAYAHFGYMFKSEKGHAVTCCDGKGMQAYFYDK